MEKDQQIEEMAMSIAECNGTTCDNCALKCKAYITCEILYDKDYRKLPEDSVVLSREEYNEIKMYQSYIPEMKKAFDKVRNAAIKETAEKILNELIDSSNKITFFDCRMALGLDKLAKQFGLEIKE